MPKIILKICGLMKAHDLKLCMQLGVDIVGFVTEYPLPVPWNLDRTEAAKLLKEVRSPCTGSIVTGGSPEKVISLAAELKPSIVQLHYRESLEDTIIISDALRKMGIAVVKTIPLAPEERLAQFNTDKISEIVNELNKTSIFALLADSRSPSNAASAGEAIDCNFYRQISTLSKKPTIAAGGITPENVCEILHKTGAGFIDIMTGVEISPGGKDARLLSRLIESVQNCPAARPGINKALRD